MADDIVVVDTEEEETVVDNGTSFVSSESAEIAEQAAREAKLWAEESERQALSAIDSADSAAQARDDAVAAKNDAVAAKEYAEAAVTDANVVAVGTDLRATPSNIKTVANNISDITTVAGISSNVTTVAGNTTNINTVAGVSSNVTTVATNISNVNNVSSISSDVTTVSGISNDVTAVAGNATDIIAVAANNTNITAVANNATNINAVNANKTNIDKVASDINRVNLVADDIASVHTVAVDISTVIDVANNKTNIDAVAGNETNITAVANNATNINAVNANKTNIDAVVANSSNINTVSTNISDVNTAATNIIAIQNASTYATNAANSANLAEDWATKMDGLVDNIDYSAKYYADQARQAAAGAVVDGVTINRNTNDELQAIGVIDNNGGNALKTWTGTLAQYNALKDLYIFNPVDYIGDPSVFLNKNKPKVGDFVYDANRNLLGTVSLTHTSHGDYYIQSEAFRGDYRIYGSEYALNSIIDSNTLYNITDDSNMATSILEAIYPVGSIYIGTMASCPLAALFGTWTLVAANRVLQGSGANSAGATIAAGLPNITGSFLAVRDNVGSSSHSGALYVIPESDGDWTWPMGSSGAGTVNRAGLGLNASLSNSIYGNSNTVQPPAYVVNIWERTA